MAVATVPFTEMSTTEDSHVPRRFRHGQTWTLPRVVRTPRDTRLHQTLRR